MQVKPLPQVQQQEPSQDQAKKTQQDFRDILLAKVSGPPLLYSAPPAGATGSLATAPLARIHLGTLSEATPTIFSLLYRNREYVGSWEEIVHSSVNKDIDYRHLPLGTEVFLEKNSDVLVLIPPQEKDGLEANNSSSPGQPASHAKIDLGTIDGDAPTVSHLLKKNDQTRADTWRILERPINRHKDFTNIQPGTEIFLDPATGEILWSASKDRLPDADQASGAESSQNTVSGHHQPESHPVSLGKICIETPTVLHLLVGNSSFHDKAWQILSSQVNQDKHFTELQDGTEIFLKPDTGELLWEDALSPPATAITQPSTPSGNTDSLADLAPAAPPQHHKMPEFSSRLANAVKPYYGRPYDEIDCYGLVVRGLRRMGIKYIGTGGIRDRLVHLAHEKGLPPNSFFNGEGLIEAAGEKVFSRTFQQVGNANREADRLFRDISSKLQKGDILSFSTESSGHTGIISSQGSKWTFINSGELDNTVSGLKHPAKGVGEENLQAEIKNWLKKAHAEGQSLQVTLGRLQAEKLRAAMQPQRPIISSTL